MYTRIDFKNTIIYLVLIALIGLITYSMITQLNKSKVPGKLDRLPCHKKVTAFERSYSDSEIQSAKKMLLGGNYKINSDIDKAKFMKTTLFDFISIEDTDQYLYDFIAQKTDKHRVYSNGISVEYTIYENDIKDPKKKSDKCKLYRGYIVLKIKNSNYKTLYQVQIDFMDYEGKDIFKTLRCAINSFLTY